MKIWKEYLIWKFNYGIFFFQKLAQLKELNHTKIVIDFLGINVLKMKFHRLFISTLHCTKV